MKPVDINRIKEICFVKKYYQKDPIPIKKQSQKPLRQDHQNYRSI